MDLIPSPSQTAGPFFHLGLITNQPFTSLAGPEAKGEKIRLTCKVLDGAGKPVNDAMLEIWQANAEGKYRGPENQGDGSIEPDFQGFARVATDEDGTCILETIKPGRVPGRGGQWQAPHLNVSVFAR